MKFHPPPHAIMSVGWKQNKGGRKYRTSAPLCPKDCKTRGKKNTDWEKMLKTVTRTGEK